ncbi:VanZ like protein [Scopulibacillus darangshiensis]|uniref:VanZ like protein n=1 Tax=Scopulibacillus darangshiensis TaxID=442528 RepID=A0A4R2NZX9_9BACL|nr:VanZ family protein [Scopulibacillus darangshiensis]TCP27802.1 VanZ like protein [Scopulibacillus darangshiensis]
MKVLITVAWAVALFILTCNANLSHLLHNHVLQFRWTSQPNFADLLNIDKSNFVNPHYLVQKAGHFLGFSVLALLLLDVTQSYKKALGIAVFFAVFTEIMQLYFTRDGRVLDMGIDTLGIVMAFGFMNAARRRVGKEKAGTRV